jgi:uncharacterized NAD(P)/FAD-binding protein YdhS
MFAISLRVVTHDGETEVPVTPRAVVAFEREFQTGLGKAFATDQRAEHMFWLAWKASNSKQTFDAWLETLVDVQIVEQEELPLSETP